MFQSPLRSGARGPMIAPPLSLFDAAPEADGAAAVILSANPGDARPAVRVAASAVGTDAVAIADRPHLLYLRAAALSAKRAYDAAGIVPADIDVFELHDSFSVLAALSLEACGMRQPGDSGPVTRPAISTFGGLKARGHPIGATGVYQIAEVARQLRGDAGPNQVEGASLGMAQCLGGMGGTAVTHIMTKALIEG
jgi:acetyl-CoA C-acetyltransferase